jgi:Spy/CpxP family protein refolding chaperone
MTRTRALSLACFALVAAPLAFAQPPAPAPPNPPANQMQGNRMHDDHMRSGGPAGAGMGIVPPGTWWRNPNTIAALTLTTDQQKKLDSIFLESRIGLIHLHASLEEEQLKLEPLLNANPPDQAKALAEISKIADLRADLEKADAKMLLSLRGVLTADQWTKLQADQHSHHDRPVDGRGQKRGPGGPGGTGAGPQGAPPAPGGPQGPGPGAGPGPRSSADPNGPDLPPPPPGVLAN